MPEEANRPLDFFRTMAALALFGVSFGYVEAAVVVYLRELVDPIRAEVLGGRFEDAVFPLLTVSQVEAADPDYMRLVWTELGRELATLVMLAGAGLTFARNFRQWLAGFMIAFGVWDIFYYVFLKLLLDWPASLWTWDILFLLPVPWVGPVISPVLIALAMITAGKIILWRERNGRPIDFRWYHWTPFFGGGAIAVAAFCWDWRNAAAGGMPNPFNWPLYWTGVALGAAGFFHAVLFSPAVVEPELAADGAV